MSPATRWADSHRPPCRKRGRQRPFVEIVEFAADGHAVGEAGDRNAQGRDQVGDVVRGRLAFDALTTRTSGLPNIALIRKEAGNRLTHPRTVTTAVPCEPNHAVEFGSR